MARVVVKGREVQEPFDPRTLKAGQLFECKVGFKWFLCVKAPPGNAVKAVCLNDGLLLSLTAPLSDYRPFTSVAEISNEVEA